MARDRTFARSLVISLAEAVGLPCPYCAEAMAEDGDRQATRDHIRPKRKGPAPHKWNRAVVCRRCNGEKGGQGLGNYYRRLRRQSDPRAAHVMLFMRRHDAYVAAQIRRQAARNASADSTSDAPAK